MDFDDILKNHELDYEDIERDKIYRLGDIVKFGNKQKFSPTISYHYLNINQIPEYCFNHTEFSADDYNIYFRKIRTISQLSYEELITQKDKILDFVVYNGMPRKELKECFKKLIGGNLRDEQLPTFGRIGLYNGEKKGDKAPRIFFFVGHHCTIHMLLFDPFHDLYPDDMKYAE